MITAKLVNVAVTASRAGGSSVVALLILTVSTLVLQPTDAAYGGLVGREDQPLKGAVMKIDHHSKLSLKSIFRYLFGSFINYWNVTHSNTISVKKTEEKNA